MLGGPEGSPRKSSCGWIRQVRKGEQHVANNLGSGSAGDTGGLRRQQFGLVDTSKLSYQVANFLGSAVLAVVAVIDWQLGFILLEGAWALISLWGIATILRGGTTSPRAH